jgi:hypothetical protein
MIIYLQKLDEAFAHSSLRSWHVGPTLRPDLDSDVTRVSLIIYIHTSIFSLT